MKKITKFYALSALSIVSSLSYSQTCYDLTQTTPTGQFVLAGDMATDSVTGLVWKRCAYGQQWNADTSSCTGNAVRVSWQQALSLADDESSTDLNTWRIPNVKELASIVERRCVDPAVNTSIFPNAPAEDFWTSTTSANNYQQAWAVTFYSGRNNQQGKNVDKYIRLVKFAESN